MGEPIPDKLGLPAIRIKKSLIFPRVKRLAFLTFLSDNYMDGLDMKGSEFLKKIKTLGKTKGIKVELLQRRGKGSHSTLLYGRRFTIIRNLKDKLKTGTYKAMLKQLGIKEDDLR